MKLDRFTRVCINIVLILLIALLVKSLVIVPKDVYAKGKIEYKAIHAVAVRRELAVTDKAVALEKLLNQYSEQGWKFRWFDGNLMIFER